MLALVYIIVSTEDKARLSAEQLKVKALAVLHAAAAADSIAGPRIGGCSSSGNYHASAAFSTLS
jgi:hypothetical protein